MSRAGRTESSFRGKNASSDASLQDFSRQLDIVTQKLSTFGDRAGHASGGGGSGASGGVGPSAPSSVPGAIQAVGDKLGAGFGGPGGVSQQSQNMLGGFFGGAISGVLNGGGAGMASTPPALINSPEARAVNTVFGAANGAIDATVGKIPIVGDFAKQQLAQIEQSVRQPIEQAGNRLSGVAGSLAAAGYKVSDEDLRAGSALLIQQERARLETTRRAQQMVWRTGVVDQGAISYGISQIGN